MVQNIIHGIPMLTGINLQILENIFWLPNGSTAISVAGQSVDVTSTYTVTSIQNGNNISIM